MLSFSPPKTNAGLRTVIIPDVIMPDLTTHLDRFTGPAEDALIFTSPEGTLLRHSNFRRRAWLPALKAAGLSPIHFHDLRHTGNDLASAFHAVKATPALDTKKCLACKGKSNC